MQLLDDENAEAAKNAAMEKKKDTSMPLWMGTSVVRISSDVPSGDQRSPSLMVDTATPSQLGSDEDDGYEECRVVR